jgi:hypothetical protein
MANVSILPKVSIVTINWNGEEDTVRCIKSLLNLEYDHFEIIVIDNGSTDKSVINLSKRFQNKIKIISNDINLGYSKAVNLGIDHVLSNNSDFLLIINNDTLVHPKLLDELINLTTNEDAAGLVCGKTYFLDGSRRLMGGPGKIYINKFKINWERVKNQEDKGQYDKIIECNYVDDYHLLIKADVFREVGKYDEDFFAYGEESDFCLRVAKSKFKIFFTPKAKIWHKGASRIGNSKNYLREFYINRSNLILNSKHLGKSTFLIFLINYLFFNIPKSIIRSLIFNKPNDFKTYFGSFLSFIFWYIGSDNYSAEYTFDTMKNVIPKNHEIR